MKKIMFNDKYGLTQAVLEGRKTMTRRIIPINLIQKYGHNKFNDRAYELFRHCVAYQPGEKVAVAQKYKDLPNPFAGRGTTWADTAGWENKMFVKAEDMPHRIKITNIKVERLQDISDVDCLKEGVERYRASYICGITTKKGGYVHYLTPYEAFSSLIDKICGKGTWESNPWVFAYEFKLIVK